MFEQVGIWEGRRGRHRVARAVRADVAGEQRATYELPLLAESSGADRSAAEASRPLPTASADSESGDTGPRARYTSPPGSLTGAVAELGAAVAALADADLEAEADQGLLDAVQAVYALADRLAGQQVRLLEAVDRRDAHRADGAVTPASWLRGRTRTDHATASRHAQAARRLRTLPRLRDALEEGAVSLAHVLAVTDAAAPRRTAAIAEHEATLVDLARAASPREMRRAVRRIADLVDPDGTTSPPLTPGPDERRHLDLRSTFDGLWELHATLDTVQGELLATALNALDTPDPAATPPLQRRTAGQRRADALGALARRTLDSGDLPRVHGTKPHLLLLADLHTLAGNDHRATRAPRLRFAGPITPDLARRITAETGPTVQAVLTLGPWRAVNVGRTHRSLPAWLRPTLEAIHGHCRGPDCDRRVVWTQAHHQQAWSDGGETDLNAMIPLCPAHHDLVTTGGWHVHHDPDTGTCTWTSPTGHVRHTHPPDPLPERLPAIKSDDVAPHRHTDLCQRSPCLRLPRREEGIGGNSAGGCGAHDAGSS